MRTLKFNLYFCGMDSNNEQALYAKLRGCVEEKAGLRLKYRGDFVSLSEQLQVVTGQRLSETTLRRFWGYQESGMHSATVRTLDILCQFVGMKTWEDFVKSHSTEAVSVVAENAAEETAANTSENVVTEASTNETAEVVEVVPSAENVKKSPWKWVAAAAGVVLAGGAALACLQSRDFSQDGIEYRVTSYLNGKVAVAACSKDAKGHVSVPEMVSNWGRTYCVTALDEEAFYGCKGLTEVVLPAGVETIGDRAFKCCENLSSIEMQDGVTKLGTELFRTCPRLKDVRLSKSLLELPEYCFSGDSIGLVSLVLPDGIRTIGRDAFGKCKELKTVHMPENLETLGRGAFWECRKLEHVTLPRSLRSMGDVEFWYCDHLQSITLLCPTPPAVDSPFEKGRTSSVILRIPKDNVDAYRASSWASLNIEPIEL